MTLPHCLLKLEMRGKAQRVARPAQTRLQNSGVTGTKLTCFSDGEEDSSVLLTRASMLRSSHPLWNASAQNESAVCGMPIFSDSRQKIGYHSNVP